MTDPTPVMRSDEERRDAVVVADEETVFSGFLSLVQAKVTFTRFDGARQSVTRLSLERGDSVAVLVVNRTKRVVYLVEQFRYSTLKKGEGWIVELPAGVIRPGEDEEQSAAREVAEETGYVLASMQHISTFFVSPGGTSERIILYVAFVDGLERDAELAKRTQDADEDILLHEVPIDDFMKLALNGQIDDAKTLIAGLWMHANRERLELR